MNNQTTHRHRKWQTHINQWQTSGATQAAYCRKHRLKLHQFVYWRSKLTTATTNEPDKFADKTGSCFVPVVMEQTARAELTVTLPNGLRIEGIGSSTIALMQRLVGALS